MTAIAEMIEQARTDTDLDPSEAQRAAGNYRKGKFWWKGLPLTIENPKGSTRSGTSKAGKSWSTTMQHDYGYIRRTESEADGDHIDVFMGPDHGSELVFVIDQTNATGKFDEHKVMLGFVCKEDAKQGYLDSYSKGWNGFAAIRPMTLDEFKEWIDTGDTSKPAQHYARSKDAIQYRATHAPHNLTLNGKQFKGGQFIPSSDIAAASPEERKQLLQSTGQTGDLDQRTKAVHSHVEKIHPVFGDHFKAFHEDPQFKESGTVYTKNFDPDQAGDMYHAMQQKVGKDFGGGKVVDLGGGRLGFASSAGSVVVAPDQKKPGRWKVAYTVHTKMVDQAHGLQGPQADVPTGQYVGPSGKPNSPWTQTPTHLGPAGTSGNQRALAGSQSTPGMEQTKDHIPQPEPSQETPAAASAVTPAQQPTSTPAAPQKPPHEMTRAEFGAQSPQAQHKGHIKAALKAGHSIPFSVLKDYPELMREASRPPKSTPSGPSDKGPAQSLASQTSEPGAQPGQRTPEEPAASAPKGEPYKPVAKPKDDTYRNPRKTQEPDYLHGIVAEHLDKNGLSGDEEAENHIRAAIDSGKATTPNNVRDLAQGLARKPEGEIFNQSEPGGGSTGGTVTAVKENPKLEKLRKSPGAKKLSSPERLKQGLAGHLMAAGFGDSETHKKLLHEAIDKGVINSHQAIRKTLAHAKVLHYNKGHEISDLRPLQKAIDARHKRSEGQKGSSKNLLPETAKKSGYHPEALGHVVDMISDETKDHHAERLGAWKAARKLFGGGNALSRAENSGKDYSSHPGHDEAYLIAKDFPGAGLGSGDDNRDYGQIMWDLARQDEPKQPGRNNPETIQEALRYIREGGLEDEMKQAPNATPRQNREDTDAVPFARAGTAVHFARWKAAQGQGSFTFDEEAHPRQPSGSTHAGEFVSKDAATAKHDELGDRIMIGGIVYERHGNKWFLPGGKGHPLTHEQVLKSHNKGHAKVVEKPKEPKDTPDEKAEIPKEELKTEPAKEKPKWLPKPETKTKSPTKAISGITGNQKTVAHIDKALSEISKLHKIPEGMPSIPVKTNAGTRTLGMYKHLAFSGTPVEIAVSIKGKHPRMTFAHEFGHFLDHQLGKENMGSGWDSRNGNMGSRATPAGPLMKAINDSNAIKEIQEISGSRQTIEKEIDHPTLGKIKVKVRPNPKYYGYLLQSHEKFARAYAQYVANKSGDETMKSELANMQTLDKNLAAQWKDDDFAPIAEAFDKYFEARGLKA